MDGGGAVRGGEEAAVNSCFVSLCAEMALGCVLVAVVPRTSRLRKEQNLPCALVVEKVGKGVGFCEKEIGRGRKGLEIKRKKKRCKKRIKRSGS